jgi:GMP synthase (glutamine-hydrolysing)
MNVYEESKYPFLNEENSYIQTAISKKIPYLGVCLGAQLLAKAMDVKVYKAPREEIGWDLVDIRAEAKNDPVFGIYVDNKLKVLQWHGDTFDLPKGARHLASNSVVPHQAYAADNLFYGLQFHIEVNRPMIEDWFKNRADLGEMLKSYDTYKNKLDQISEKIFDSFFALGT